MPYIGFSTTDQQQFAVFSSPDINGTKLIIDADGDTSITADTDDQIDIEVAGSDEIRITAAMIAPSTADGSALGGTSNEWSDLYLADGAVIGLGADQDVTLTHVADTGILLSSTDQLQFGDSGTYIFQSADGVLDLVSDTEIEINATTIDVNGTTNFSGAITPAASDGAAIGSASLEWSDLYIADGGVIYFGDDQDVKITHVADTGLTIKNAHTSGNSGVGAVLTLQTGDTDMADGNVMGHIKFQAPDEGQGTDAILVGAGMVFQTASSETATEKMRLDSNGDLGIGVANPTRQLHIAKSAAADIVVLTDGATVTPDFAAGQNFSLTLAGNRTLANPTNIVAGQTGSIVVTQDGSGSRTLAYGTFWDFAGGTAPTLTTTASRTDRLDYMVASATDIHAVATLDMV